QFITGKFRKIEEALSKYNSKALNPEVESAFEIISSQTIGEIIGNKNIAQVDFKDNESVSVSVKEIKHHDLEVEECLKDALRYLKLPVDHLVFVDGIDFRPESKIGRAHV